jgi:hypothetical protein
VKSLLLCVILDLGGLVDGKQVIGCRSGGEAFDSTVVDDALGVVRHRDSYFAINSEVKYTTKIVMTFARVNSESTERVLMASVRALITDLLTHMMIRFSTWNPTVHSTVHCFVVHAGIVHIWYKFSSSRKAQKVSYQQYEEVTRP